MPERRVINGYIVERRDDGTIVTIGRADQPAQPPVDPSYQVNRATVQPQIQRSQADATNAAVEASINAATQGDQVRRTAAETVSAERQSSTAGLPEGFRWSADGTRAEPIPGYSRQGITPEVRQSAIQAFTDAAAIDAVVADLRSLYEQGPGSTSGPRGVQDYLPLTENKNFDNAGQRARGYVKRALGFTGGEGNTVAESTALYDPYLPKASDLDGEIVRKIDALEALGAQARQRAVATLGGIPDANGNITPVPQGVLPNAMTIPRIISGDQALQAAGTGATSTLTPIPPEMQAEYEQWVRARIGQGFTPEAYIEMRQSLDRKYGYGSGDYIGEAERILDGYRRGGTLNLGIPGAETDLSGAERLRNNIASNPVGAGVLGYTDAVGFGGVSALDPMGMAAIREANPLSTTVGDIAGAMTGAAGLSKIAAGTIGRAAPRLMGGGARGLFGRNVATDAGYAGIYGTVSGQDPLESVAYGTAGSIVGQGVGSALGRAVTGVTNAPAAQRLKELGVMPTIGQIMRSRAMERGGNSLIAGIEDVGDNSSFLGGPINAARARSLEQANIAAMNVGARGRGQVTQAGDAGIQQLEGIAGRAYSDALGGVSIPLDDPRFGDAMDAAMLSGQSVDAARGTRDFELGMQRDILPVLGQSSLMNGQMLQDAQRALSTNSRAYSRAAESGGQPSARYVADAFNEVGSAITDAAGEYAPQAMPGLQEANRVYRNLSILDDAAGRGLNNGGIFTGAQLGQAMNANANRFRTGRKGLSNTRDMDLATIQRDMQDILPNQVPPTGANAAPAMALLGAGGLATAQMSENDYVQGAGTLAGLGLLASPYTRPGQIAAAKALLDRPESIRNLGQLIRRRQGLFGSAGMAPLVVGQATAQ